MLVLIAPEKDIPKEIAILNRLFKAGLQRYHLRKPSKNYKEHVAYINQIDKQYHNKVVVHYHHKLINHFNLKGIHFPEHKRKDVLMKGSGYLNDLNTTGKTVSSSFHDLKQLESCTTAFNYHLLGPVFTSISKVNYKGLHFKVDTSSKCIVAVGGITKENIIEAIQLGFKGFAVLGSVWNSEKPVECFKSIKETYDALTEQSN